MLPTSFSIIDSLSRYSASVAGISLPTDPAVILGLGNVAQNLADALPTPPVLSVLLTAAPPSFVSNIVHDQSFANSFESAFAAGSSPSWFNALPTGVKSYLHTYSGFGGLAQAAGAVESGALKPTSTAKATTRSAASTGSAASATAASATVASATSGRSVSENAATGSTATSSSARSTTSPNSAASISGAMGVSFVGVVGILGLVIAAR